MSLCKELRRSLKTFERETRHPILIWKGANYPCTVSLLNKGNILSLGGNEEVIHLTLLVRKDVMPEPLTADADIITADSDQFTVDQDYPPATGKRVSVQMPVTKRQYRVIGVDEPAAGSHWQFHLGSVNR